MGWGGGGVAYKWVLITVIVFIYVKFSYFKKVLFKLSSSGTADLIDLSVILEKLKMNHSTFLDMCIVAGCDYLKNVHGIGIKKAKGIVCDEHFLEKLASLPNAEANYSGCFLTAQCIFKHQTVFHVLENSLKPLHPWPTDGTSDQHLQACGQYLFLLLIFINSIPGLLHIPDFVN